MIRLPRPAIVAGLTLALSAPLLAITPEDAVSARIHAYRELGAAFKGVNDSLRGGEVQTVIVQQYARQIRNASRQQYEWFPAGSDARTGIKTAVLPEVWTRPAEFKAAQDAFAAEATAFQAAVRSNDAGTIRAAARKLGGTCKGCHEIFRRPDKD